MFLSSPSLADFDNNGDLEIVASSYSYLNRNSMTYIFNHDGSIVSGWPQYTAENDYYSTIIGDINNDNKADVLTTSGGMYSCIYYNNCGGVYAWDSNGNLINSFPKPTEREAFAPATIADIDNDGKVELIASSDWDYDYTKGEYKYRGSIYVWDLEGQYSADNAPWPTFHQNTERTGLYPTKLKSQIINEGDTDITGTLIMKVQQTDGSIWTDVKIVVNQETTIPANNNLALDTIWEQEGAYTTTEIGNFRVYAEFAYDNNVISNSYEFIVE